jgi:hypothetical protein
MTNTEASILAHHGIASLSMTDDQRTDAARAAGLVSLCLGCGTVQGINPADLAGHPDAETARRATRDHVDTDCCPDADTIVY